MGNFMKNTNRKQKPRGGNAPTLPTEGAATES
jgi:hypothetical protein